MAALGLEPRSHLSQLPRALSGLSLVFARIFISSCTTLWWWFPVCKSWLSGDFMGLSRSEVHTSWQRTPSTNRDGIARLQLEDFPAYGTLLFFCLSGQTFDFETEGHSNNSLFISCFVLREIIGIFLIGGGGGLLRPNCLLLLPSTPHLFIQRCREGPLQAD